MKTFMQTKETVARNWYVIDAKDIPLGRVAAKAAAMLRGKHKATYTPNVDCGDCVIIINASKAVFTGANKGEDKLYHSYSGYFGSLKSVKFEDMLKNNPVKLYKLAVRGMLPKTKLGKEMIKKLFVYEGSEHPHTAQTTKKGK